VLLNVKGLPSGLEPVTTWSAVAFWFTVMFAGWLSSGGRQTLFTVSVNDFVSQTALPLHARIVTV